MNKVHNSSAKADTVIKKPRRTRVCALCFLLSWLMLLGCILPACTPLANTPVESSTGEQTADSPSGESPTDADGSGTGPETVTGDVSEDTSGTASETAGDSDTGNGDETSGPVGTDIARDTEQGTGNAPEPVTDPARDTVPEPETIVEPGTEKPVYNDDVFWHDAEILTEKATSTGAGTDEPVEPDNPLHPGNSEKYRGVLISKVYGTGKKNADASASHGFIQLANPTDSDISLSGLSLYYKTDDAKPYKQFAFPSGSVIRAGGVYLVRANSPEGYNPESAVLSIDSFDAEWDVYVDNKEIRLLLAPSGWALASGDDILSFDDAVSVFYASETLNLSVYAVQNLSKDKVAVRTALTDYSGFHTVKLTEADTPDLKTVCPDYSGGHNTVVKSCLNEVTFSHVAGVYARTVNLKLTAPAGFTIYYTKDGTNPATSKTRTKYTVAISLTDSSAMSWGPLTKAWRSPAASTMPGGYVIKAYATNGIISTPVYTNTYFINAQMAAYGVSVLSFSIPQSEMMGQGFYANYMPTGNIVAARPRGKAVMETFDPDGNRVGHANVELSVSGNGSSGWAMKSLKIYLKGKNNTEAGMDSQLNYDVFGGTAIDEYGQAITSFSRLLIRNSGNDCACSYIRDAYMQRVCAPLDCSSMATATVLVFFNGEFWGVYNIRERFSRDYVEEHTGVDKENAVVLETDYSQVHTNTDVPFVLTSGNEGDQDPFNNMVTYMRSHDMADPKEYAYICSLMDVDSFIDVWTSRIFFVTRDWPENNVKVWRNKNPDDPSGFDTKWRFCILDMDMGLSFYDFTTENENYFGIIGSGSIFGAMMRALLKSPEFKQQFINRYYELCTQIFTPEYLSTEFEAMYAERNPLMQLQVDRWGASDGASISTWNSAVSKIRKFIANRSAISLKHMFSYFGVSEADIGQAVSKRMSVTFNSNRVEVYVNGDGVKNGQSMSFDGDAAQYEVDVLAREGYVITSLVWTGLDGKSRTLTRDGVENVSVRFTVTGSGSLAVYAKTVSSQGETFTGGTLVAGATYLFYLDDSGELYGWGDNRVGILALNSNESVITEPTHVMSGVKVVSTTTSANYESQSTQWSTAILTTDGRLFTVGCNNSGQLGRNGTADDSKLGEVSFKYKIKDVSVGFDHMLIIDENNVLWGVGNNSYNQLGTKAGSYTDTFVRIADHISYISAGRRSTVYVDENGNLFGLGDNRWNKMVYGGEEKLTKPTLLLENCVFISSGEHQSLAIDSKGALYYFGWRTLEGFSQGGGNNPALARVMASGAKSASMYFGNLVIVTKDGKAYGYGLNTENGLGQSAQNSKPFEIKLGCKVVSAAAGYGFSAFLTENGEIIVQGDNTYGQAGVGQAGGAVSMQRSDF